ncbi:hypothetical protein TRICI_006418 [Trichomonascus ciferrii]|uniref:PHD-type domain-containing protein n=1 Tax=Trichomonascus ciferrii TaxID=44093 RepID=A0A642UHD4_9ASCO|nr:hypothetical protein TRICI_006418 [Trichomonascus ciferrii]
MEDLQLDLRRSLRLIGTLDKRTNELMEDVDDQLKKLQGMSVGDSFRGDVVTDVARKSSDARLLRLNCLDEAKYMCESVEYVYSQISAEIVKLKNPAWVKDGESNAGKVEMRLTRRQRQEKEEAEKRRENEVEAEKMRAKEKEKEKKDEQAAQKKREARAADKKRHEVETTEKANSRKKKQGREENKRNVQRQKRKRGAQGEPVEQEEAEETEAADDEPRYCFCNDVFYGEMIGCDDPKCKKEWFHLGCVNLRRAPKGEWICPECTERRQKDAQRKRKRRR